jgi:hypothetical protein
VIVPCKFCKGKGRVSKGSLTPFSILAPFSEDEVCPVCKGAGEFEINLPPEKVTTCKRCNGEGIIVPANPYSPKKVCPACQGTGIVERPTVGTKQTGKNEVTIPQTPRLSGYEYDVAVSFAGEDRRIVKEYCDMLSPYKLKVFYDEYEQVALWGENLYDKLDEIYRTKARFCVIFISKNYAAKVWTNHERKAAQARALQENRAYILPVKLDDTEIPGIPPTIGYIDLRKVTVKNLVDITLEKVKNHKSS